MLAAISFPAFAEDSTSSAINPLIKKPITNTKVKIAEDKLETRDQRVKDRINAMRERIASKAASLKLRLQEFKDQKKAEIAGRINDLLNRINEKQTTQMQKHLDTMTTILGKLQDRVNKGTPDIKDPSGAKTAIASASAAIASASASVVTQAQRDYTIVVTSEGKIGIDAKTQRDKLYTDLLSIRKIVNGAKQEVANAIRIAKSLPNTVGKEKEGTRSGER